MNHFISQIINKIIVNQAILNNHPKPGVIFLTPDALFKDAECRKTISDAVASVIDPTSFDSVAGIASRGYLFSEMIANRFNDKGENLIQKAKSFNNPKYIQMGIETEYSSDTLEVRKDSIQQGKKYLIADDLIATGGSIIAAIKLIRACGGEVNNVFVMTELLDFNAREALQKEGVELISLLKFTKQDLQQLLLIQEQYLENSLAPITYQLSHYTSEKQQLNTQQINMSRLVNLNHNDFQKKFAKKGIIFTSSTEINSDKTINLYNQGCPVKTWNIDTNKTERNNFKIFSTGDSFSVLSPDVAIAGENISIHVGLEHDKYSPLVLLQEAMQLCRSVYEHGAEKITISLPEEFHPILHANDFNFLLMKLFKASGANEIYFYDKKYTGQLDETNINETIALTIGDQSDIEHYEINQQDLVDYLHLTNQSQNDNLDSKIMASMRNNKLNHFMFKSNFNHNLIKPQPAITVPQVQNKPHVLLCCSANKPLAEKIANNLLSRGEKVEVYFIEGKGDKATIPSEAKLCGSEVTIVQSTRPNPDHLDDVKEYEKNGACSYFFEAAMVARQAHLRGASKVNLINPYQFSARSDKAEDNPKGKTGSYVQQNGMLLEAAGVNQVITAECHDTHTMSGSYTNKKIKGLALPALTIISTQIVSDWISHHDQSSQGQLRLVTPDAGATKRTKDLTAQLQSIIGKKLCTSRILGEKQRDSHQDDSALVNSLNSGDVGINANDRYLLTDDETATGTTLCQAIKNLTANGAKNISVIVVHNNMPLDWLLRQLCLSRFLYLGVNDLHFSDTQEMGSLAKDYENLIENYSVKSLLSKEEIEKQVLSWFTQNIAKDFTDNSPEYFQQEFTLFKDMFKQFESRITIHSLADEFANKVSPKHIKVNVAEKIVDLPKAKVSNFYSSVATLFSPNTVQKVPLNESVRMEVKRGL